MSEYLSIFNPSKTSKQMKNEIMDALNNTNICDVKIGKGSYGTVIKKGVGPVEYHEGRAIPIIYKEKIVHDSDDFKIRIANGRVYVISSGNFILSIIIAYYLNEMSFYKENFSFPRILNHGNCSKIDVRNPNIMIMEEYGVESDDGVITDLNYYLKKFYNKTTKTIITNENEEVDITFFLDNIFLNTVMYYFYCKSFGLQILDVSFLNMFLQDLNVDEVYIEDDNVAHLEYMYFKFDDNRYIKIKTFGFLIKFGDLDIFTFEYDNVVLLNNVLGEGLYDEKISSILNTEYMDFIFYQNIVQKQYKVPNNTILDKLKIKLKYEPSSFNDMYNSQYVLENIFNFVSPYVVEEPEDKGIYAVFDYTKILSLNKVN